MSSPDRRIVRPAIAVAFAAALMAINAVSVAAGPGRSVPGGVARPGGTRLPGDDDGPDHDHVLGFGQREPLRRRHRDHRRGVHGALPERRDRPRRQGLRRHPGHRAAAVLRAESPGHPRDERWLRPPRAAGGQRPAPAPRRLRRAVRLERHVRRGGAPTAALLRRWQDLRDRQSLDAGADRDVRGPVRQQGQPRGPWPRAAHDVRGVRGVAGRGQGGRPDTGRPGRPGGLARHPHVHELPEPARAERPSSTTSSTTPRQRASTRRRTSRPPRSRSASGARATTATATSARPRRPPSTSSTPARPSTSCRGRTTRCRSGMPSATPPR